MAEDQAPECCKGCDLWEKHKQSCFYYWEAKKDCTMHSDN